MSRVAVTAVERVVAILEAFQAARRPLSLTELATAIGVPKSSCHAIVSTLLARGCLYSLKRPRALYPTRRLYDVTRDILQHDPFIQHAMPLLQALRDATRETVIFGKRQGDAVVYLEVVEGPNPIRYSATPGAIKPLHSSSIGKAMLGSLQDSDLRSLLKTLPLPAVTEATLTSSRGLLDDLARGRKRGYYVTRGENVADVWAVAGALMINGEALAVSVAGPGNRMQASLKECARQVVGTCSLLARQVGAEPGGDDLS